MAVRRRIPKPIIIAAAKTAPRVVKEISRAARGAMPRGTSARTNPKAAKARAAYSKKVDRTEARRRSMAEVSRRSSDPRSYDTSASRRRQAIRYDSKQQKALDRLGGRRAAAKRADATEGRRRAMAAVGKKSVDLRRLQTPKQKLTTAEKEFRTLRAEVKQRAASRKLDDWSPAASRQQARSDARDIKAAKARIDKIKNQISNTKESTKKYQSMSPALQRKFRTGR